MKVTAPIYLGQRMTENVLSLLYLEHGVRLSNEGSKSLVYTYSMLGQ